MKDYNVYIALTSRGNYYTGIATNIDRRIHEHNYTNKGAKCLRGQRPVILVWQSKSMSRSDALKEEYRIKQLSHQEKKSLVDSV